MKRSRPSPDSDSPQPARGNPALLNGGRQATGAARAGRAVRHQPPSPADPPWLAELNAYRETLSAQSSQLSSLRLELETAVQKNSDLFDFAPIPYFVLDRMGCLEEVNLAAATLFGVPRAKMDKLPLRSFVLFGDRARVLEHMRKCRSSSGRVITDLRLNCPGQGYTHIELISRRSLTVEGLPISFPTIALDLTSRERAIAQRNTLLQKLIDAQEDERRRLSRELHDELGQHITALVLGLRALDAQASGEQPGAIKRLLAIADQMGREAHRVATNLRPTALDDLGLDEALRNHVAEWSQQSNVAVDYASLGCTGVRWPPHVETTIYRAVQESLNNIARHAAAEHVSVVLDARPNEIHVIVEDDGRGFEPQTVLPVAVAGGHYGLLGMRERVELAGGGLDVESAPGKGATVFLRIPIQSE